MHEEHDRGDFIEGRNPHAPGAELQETSFGDRETLDQIRDEVDNVMSRLIRRGNEKETGQKSLSNTFWDKLNENPDNYVSDVDGEPVVDLQKLTLDVLPDFLGKATASETVNKKKMKMMFTVAAADGIDTAYSLVMEAHPFTDDSIDNARAKLNQMNDRFVNAQISHPDTGEPVFSKCPGFRTAQALENQLITTISEMEEEGLSVDTTFDYKNSSIGESCKNAVQKS